MERVTHFVKETILGNIPIPSTSNKGQSFDQSQRLDGAPGFGRVRRRRRHEAQGYDDSGKRFLPQLS